MYYLTNTVISMEYEKSLKLVTDTLWRAQEMDEFSMLLGELLTPDEITIISDRITILSMLMSGKSQREIAETLGISVTTVTRGNKVLQKRGENITQYLS